MGSNAAHGAAGSRCFPHDSQGTRAHPNLKGVYTASDPRFVTQARDLASHRGYDAFHRNPDADVAGWVRANPNATQAQFENYLRGIYQRPDVAARFANGP